MTTFPSHLTTKETYQYDLIDATLFLSRRLVKTIENADAPKQLTDALRDEWVAGLTLTAWVSRALVRINGGTGVNASMSVPSIEKFTVVWTPTPARK